MFSANYVNIKYFPRISQNELRGNFFCCSSLTSVDIPSSVTSIERAAFLGCSSLTFVYTHLNMANLIHFTKRFESSENLVNLLESRGLQICDRNKAIQYLDNIGYYRLSAYMYPLLKMPQTAHLYKEGSTFEKVMMLYRFDKKLRLLMFNEIEKIEIAIRRAVMQITADMT
ncbi:MAG: Abi family protein, partial [Prevotellamassilia sp.]|nr:Abi family protein [Prevotellamassilia sp.]